VSALGIPSGHCRKGGGILDALPVAFSGLCIADTIDSLLVEVPMLVYQRRTMPMFTRHGLFGLVMVTNKHEESEAALQLSSENERQRSNTTYLFREYMRGPSSDFGSSFVRALICRI
jgi:hypothetical protein